MVSYIKSYLQKIPVILLGVAMPVSTVLAQTAEQASSSSQSSTNPLWWLIIAVMAILLLAILMLSNVLLNIARLVVEKANAAKGAATILLLLISIATFSQNEATTAIAPKTESAFGDWNLVMAAIVILVELFVIAVLTLRIQALLKDLSDKKEVAKPIVIHLPKLFDNINASVAVEKEKDILLDHNYDGIQELDNNLPPWWKYGFYATIVYACVYLFYFHVAGGPSSHDEYNKEVEEAKANIAAYMAKNSMNVDENSVTLADAAGIADGKATFAANCAPCHGANGEGTVGPNLTDDYWLHGGALSDVFKSVKYGWPAKGMKAWQNDLTPIQIKNVASFIKSLRGTNPANAKAPDGVLYQEGESAAATDTTTASATVSTASASK
jgi:cytochrome c oxidase cbb3-type subunit 3